MATIRVKHGISCVMFRPEGTVVLSSGAPFEDTDPIVRDNPDMFTYDVDAEAGDSVRVTAVAVGADAPVEEATAVPGQKRSARRPRA